MRGPGVVTLDPEPALGLLSAPRPSGQRLGLQSPRCEPGACNLEAGWAPTDLQGPGPGGQQRGPGEAGHATQLCPPPLEGWLHSLAAPSPDRPWGGGAGEATGEGGRWIPPALQGSGRGACGSRASGEAGGVLESPPMGAGRPPWLLSILDAAGRGRAGGSSLRFHWVSLLEAAEGLWSQKPGAPGRLAGRAVPHLSLRPCGLDLSPRGLSRVPSPPSLLPPPHFLSS